MTSASELFAITLWQPWASLMAEMIKTIETRSWPAPKSAIGKRFFLHAAKSNHCRRNGGLRVGDYKVRPFGTTGMALEGPGLPEFRSTPRLERYLLPLGSVVAVGTLVGCIPIVSLKQHLRWGLDGGQPVQYVVDTSGEPYQGSLRILGFRREGSALVSTASDIEDERPYGDYTPGRYAWLYDDIVKLPKPVRARGRQKVWRPDSATIETVRGFLVGTGVTL